MGPTWQGAVGLGDLALTCGDGGPNRCLSSFPPLVGIPVFF